MAKTRVRAEDVIAQYEAWAAMAELVSTLSRHEINGTVMVEDEFLGVVELVFGNPEHTTDELPTALVDNDYYLAIGTRVLLDRDTGRLETGRVDTVAKDASLPYRVNILGQPIWVDSPQIVGILIDKPTGMV